MLAYQIPLPLIEESRPIVGVQLFFTPARTLRTGLSVHGVPPGAGSFSIRVRGLEARVEWERPVLVHAPVTLELHEAGGNSVPVGYHWIRPKAKGTHGFSTDAVNGDDAVVEWLKRRHENINKLADSPEKAAKRFFFELDVATNYNLWVGPYDVWNPGGPGSHHYIDLPDGDQMVFQGALGSYLARVELSYLGAKPPEDNPTIFETHLPFASELFRRLLSKAFPKQGGGIDFDGARAAFELFSTGRIRYRIVFPGTIPTVMSGATNCEPDSWGYFLFADLALLCLAKGTATALWQPLAPCLLWTREVYLNLYRRWGETNPIQESYKPDYWDKHQQLGEVEVEVAKLPGLAASFGELKGLREMIDKAQEQSRRAFPGNIVPDCTP